MQILCNICDSHFADKETGKIFRCHAHTIDSSGLVPENDTWPLVEIAICAECLKIEEK